MPVLPVEPHPLSPIDQFFIGHSFSIVLRYGARLDAGRLSAALAPVLEAIPPLTCHLAEWEDGRWGLVSPGNAPPHLEVHEVPHLPEDSTGPTSSLGLVPRLSAAPGQPVLGLRLTQSPTEGLLGITLAHAVADGFSLFLFLRAWSRAVHGRPLEPLPWERNLLALEDPEPTAARSPEDFWRRTGFRWCQPPRELAAPRPASFGTRLVPPELRTLAADPALASNDLLCAWLIQTRADALAGPDGLAVTFPIDYRRVHGGLPNNYFGNAIRGAPLWLDRETLERESLPELAVRVREAVRAALNAQGARDSLACLAGLLRERGGRILGELHTVDPRAGLLVTNVASVPFGTLDFGAGPPVHVLMPAVEPRTAAIQQTDSGYELSFNAPA
ncbi:acyltransferase [Archangium violaceum]|uniref:Transferase n=1 Tax=Archangium violaceum Cb vi76 TaxID=1406225 RepID=A0A084ST38_9BACT|nr:acyltransferase [Archangium violaceum]KFA91623.1 transferase [Archangium violaceum Cb vi76]